MKIDTRTKELVGEPAIIWKDQFYVKDDPAFFFEKDFTLSGITSSPESIYGQLLKDGECINNGPRGAQIYLNSDVSDQIFVYDKTDKVRRYTQREMTWNKYTSMTK